MGTPVSALVGQVRDEFVFDATDAQILAWLNGKYATMVVDSECLTKTLDLGPSDGSGVVAVPGSVVRVRELTVDGVPWQRASHDDPAKLDADLEVLCGPGGVFCPGFAADGSPVLVLRPVPDAGVALQAVASVRDDPLTLDSSVVTPPEYDEALVNGAAATGFRRDSEQGGTADQLDALFLAGVEKLRRQTRRLARSGPRRIRVAWP